jgi:hypothetical protein
MKKIIFTVCILHSIYLSAQIWEPPVVIDPPNPMVGDTIRVGLFHTFYPPCLTLPAENFQGLTHLFEFNGNDIVLSAVNDSSSFPICNPFPVSPAPRAWYEIGQLPEGIYTLETWITDGTTPLPVPPSGYFPLLYGPIISFEVNEPPIIKTTSRLGLLFLVTFILLFTLFFSKRVST